MGLFDEQISRKPNKYPWTQDYIDAMWQGHWTPNEFSFKSDIQDYKVNCSEQEREIIKRTLSMIGQIEVAVKKYWAKLGDTLPHPSINDMGYVMAQIEVIHNTAYEKLLEVLNIDEIFEENLKLDIVKNRVNYLRKYNHKIYTENDRKQFIYSLILFTLFVENVSLFSQFYIILWFNRTKNILKDTSQQINYTKNEECLIEGTEVLTPNGWVDFRDINVDDEIFQYSLGKLEITKVLNKVDKLYEGNLIQFSRERNICIVTPNHDMVYYDVKNNLRKKKAVDLKLHKEVKIPTGGIFDNPGATVDALSFDDRLRIVIQADGTTSKWKNKNGEVKLRGKDGGYTHCITLYKKRKIDRLRYILNNLGIKYTENKASREGGFCFHLHYNHDYDYKRLNWVSVSNKSENWCREFIEEVVEWDGYKSESGYTGYCSTVKENIDKVQLVAILGSYTTNISKNNDSLKKETYSDCYKLSFIKGNHKPISHSIKKEIIEDYSGKVYCVTVPSGAIITRYKDKTFIVGNCLHASVGVKIVQVIKEEYPELFDEELENRIIEEAKVAFEAESSIVDWMLCDFNEDTLNPAVLKAYIKNRINDSLKDIGYNKPFHVNKELLEKTQWMEEETLGNMFTDFFHRRPVNYIKGHTSISEDDLF